MKTTKTIPFNWDTYQQDKEKYKLVTRDGDPITQLTRFELVGEPNEFYGVNKTLQEVYGWDENGIYYGDDSKDPRDLVLQYEEEVRDTWLKVYRVKDSSRLITSKKSFGTRDEALQSCNGLMNVEHLGVINLNEIVHAITNNK